MTHIANCMRATGELNDYISMDSASSFASQTSAASEDTLQPLPTLDKSPSLLNLHNLSSTGASKYQLWPSQQSRSPVGMSRSNFSSEKLSALSMGRSPTSLSDTAVPPETVPFWQRSGSLARRRKVSVPELGSTMTTVQEAAIDSPTIPGRPPIRKASTETFGHERSSSAPGTNWRAGPFGDALISCVTGPSTILSTESNVPAPTDASSGNKLEPLSVLGKPLSPILSPGCNPKPALKVDTTTTAFEAIDVPPEVPPKSPATTERKGSPSPLKLNSKSSRPQLMTPATLNSSGTTPTSALESRRSPNVNFPLPTPLSAISNPFSAGSPSSAVERRGSPRVEKRDPFISEKSHHTRNMSESSVTNVRGTPERSVSHNRNISEASVMDRGRPIRRSTSKKLRSRANSEAKDPNAQTTDSWQLPHGMRVAEASMRMRDSEKETLRKQALDQAEKFEVLNKRDVAATSRELRALDERCDYLRKTYKSLRAGRQKLHGRMISYLKRGETVIFSRESLLKQEEALAELDVSIDEFIQKLEQAENRRLRLRQKLLEHVAAALVLNPAAPLDLSERTPPRSPVKADSPTRADRKEVESIKIYADGQVLNLFSDIEQAIGRMCEQTC